MLSEKRSKVLVLDDQAGPRRLNAKQLSAVGYWVLTSNRLRESDPIWADEDETLPCVEELVARHYFHVVWIDLSLREMNAQDRTGFDALDLVNSMQERTRSIILTGFGKTRDVREALRKRDAHDWLDKDDLTRERLLDMTADAVHEAKVRAGALLAPKHTYHSLVARPSLAEAVQQIKAGSTEELRSVVDTALYPYLPYDTKRGETEFEQLAIGSSLLKITRWSRYLGKAVTLRFGSRAAIEWRSLAMKDAQRQNGEDYKLVEIDERDQLIGLISVEPDAMLLESLPLLAIEDE